MLVQFSVGNCLSFKEIVTFSMVPAYASDERHVTVRKGVMPLLKTAVIYGPNASGKTNLIKAMGMMSLFIRNSSKESQANELTPFEPYRLSAECDGQPSFFEIILIAQGVRYRYGFEADRTKVLREWLYHVPSQREALLFSRTEREFNLRGPFKEGRNLEDKTRDNALFLSVVAQFNGPTAGRVLKWFDNFTILSLVLDKTYLGYTVQRLQEPAARSRIVDLLKRADTDILDVGVEQVPLMSEHLPEHLPEALRQFLLQQTTLNTTIHTIHQKYDRDGRPISVEKFNLEQSESQGTQKILALAGPLVDVLENGKILIVDELDAKLHPRLTRELVRLFNSERNASAQLIFNTHDVNLLDPKLFRRDQIWFTEKSRQGETDLYSLAEYRVRSDAPFSKEYLVGKYGAVPEISELWEVFDNA